MMIQISVLNIKVLSESENCILTPLCNDCLLGQVKPLNPGYRPEISYTAYTGISYIYWHSYKEN